MKRGHIAVDHEIEISSILEDVLENSTYSDKEHICKWIGSDVDVEMILPHIDPDSLLIYCKELFPDKFKDEEPK